MIKTLTTKFATLFENVLLRLMANTMAARKRLGGAQQERNS